MKTVPATSALLLLSLASLNAQEFINVTDNHNIDIYIEDSEFGNGVSFADFNGDGLDDLSFLRNVDDPLFYVNTGTTFELIGLGIENELHEDAKMILWVDYDNDGDKDLFISTSFSPIKLYQNDGNLNLTDVSIAAGLNVETTRNFGASWGDYNKDGWLDLYVCKYHNPGLNSGYAYENNLYKNNGDGTFTELGGFAGVDDAVLPSFQSVLCDFNGDGWEDIFVINDRYLYPNSIYINEGDGTFYDPGTVSGIEENFDAMCITVGDYDNDQDMDIYVTNTHAGNKLYENQGNATFTNKAPTYGIEALEICWGSMWIDYDNDMWQDLYVASINNVITIENPDFMFRNTGTGFENVSATVWEDNAFGTLAVAQGDFNNDGYPDFVQNNSEPSSCALWQNTGGTNNWLKVSVEGTISNKDGIGAWIHLYAGDQVLTRSYQCGENFIGQDSERKIFGLGTVTQIDSLVVKWPLGMIETYYPEAINTTIHLIEGSSFSIALDVPPILCGQDSISIGAGDWFTYEWSNGSTDPILIVTEAGDYSVTVTNEGGTTFVSNTITITEVPETELAVTSSNVTCFGYDNGAITVEIVSEAPPVSIYWNDDLEGYSQENLAPGVYHFVVSDENGCSIADSVLITQPDSLYAVTLVTNPLCAGDQNGTVNITFIGGSGDVTVSPQDINWNELSAGTYDWLGTDSNQCITHFDFELIAPEELIATLSTDDIDDSGYGIAALEITGGTGDYTIEWSTDENSQSILIENAGDYWVSIEDENQCDTLIQFGVTAMEYFESMRILAYPNPFGECFTLDYPGSGIIEIEIYDRLGMCRHKAKYESTPAVICPPHHLPNGAYHLRMKSEKGEWLDKMVRLNE